MRRILAVIYVFLAANLCLAQDNHLAQHDKKILIENHVKIRKLYMFGTGGQKILDNEIELNRNGNIVRYSQFAGGIKIHSVYYTYDSLGLRKKVETYGDQELRREISEYGMNGRISSFVIYDETGIWVSTTTNEYDKNGNLLSTSNSFSNAPFSKNVYYLDNEGNIDRITSEDSLGTITYDSKEPIITGFEEKDWVEIVSVSKVSTETYDHSPIRTTTYYDENDSITKKVIVNRDFPDSSTTIFYEYGKEIRTEGKKISRNNKGLIGSRKVVADGASTEVRFEYIYFEL